MIKSTVPIALAISMVALSSQASYANGCTRHVVNETAAVFIVRVTDTREGRDKSYLIPPHTTMPISYTGLPGFTTAEHAKWFQRVTIAYSGPETAMSGRQQVVEFDGRFQMFDVRAPDFGCDSYLAHQGNTGWVTLNEPADGDIIILE